MKAPKNIRIVLVPVGTSVDRTDLEHIENNTFSSNKTLARQMAIIVGDASAKILTAEAFLKELPFTQMRKPFLLAIENNRKRKQCYKLTDFMDDFNNQEFGGETDKFWLGYVKVK